MELSSLPKMCTVTVTRAPRGRAPPVEEGSTLELSIVPVADERFLGDWRIEASDKGEQQWREESGKDAQQPQGAGEEDEVVGRRPLHTRPTHVIQISPANRGERQKRIGFGALGQRLFRELPELDTRLQRDLHNGFEHRLRSTHNIIGANSLIRLISPIKRCSSPVGEMSSCMKEYSSKFDALITKSA